MHNRDIGAAPNYRNAALVMAAVNLTCVLFIAWAVCGLAVPLLLALGLDRTIAWQGDRRRH